MTEKQRIHKFREPRLEFGYGQMSEDPRDGLTLFGPFDRGNLNNIAVGIIGTPDGIRKAKERFDKLDRPIYHPNPDIANPFFPGFEEVFEVKINKSATQTVQIEEDSLELLYRYNDNHVRVSEIVDLYVDTIIDFLNENERPPNVWLVIIPDRVYTVCRPKSTVPSQDAIHVGIKDQYTRLNEGMFETDETKRWRKAYKYENHFHNQLKIKLLKHKVLTQIIKETTIAYEQNPSLNEKKIENLRKFDTAKAWNIGTALYYKIGGLPWKLGDIRRGVCYVGLTFKQDLTQKNPKYACCAAQMFLDSGDGMVFRGRIGPYYNPETEEYHLTRESARELLEKAIESFKKKNNQDPEEIFIHGKTYFEKEEWEGFQEAVAETAQLVGIRIRPERTFKMFRNGNYPILRGSAYLQDEYTAYLWTKGFIPRIQSILGLETPNPLLVQIVKGKADIKVVCKDILALSKLNYNSCRFCDGQPVTLKFADLIGEILTAGPNQDLEVLPFMYYI